MEIGVVGPEQLATVITEQRAGNPVLLLQSDAEIVVRIGIIGLQRQRALEALDRLVVMRQCGQGIAETVMGLGPIRLQLECAAIARHRLGIALQSIQR